MLLGGIFLLSLALAVLTGVLSGAFASLAFLWVLPVSFLGIFLGLALLAFLFMWVCCQLMVDQSKPQEEDSRFYRILARVYVEAILTLVRCRLHLQGMEQLPKDGRFLLVSNHLNIMDPVVLLHVFRDSQLAFISKKENSTMFLVGNLMHKLQCQLINRENDREALKTILKCISMIKEDKASVAVFPEGYTSMDGLLHHFRHGVFKIAQKAKVPIVVVTLQNTQHILHNAARLKKTDVQLHLLTVIPPEELTGRTATDVGEQVYAMMAADLGPDKVKKYPENT